MGSSSLQNNTSGNCNTAIGLNALFSNTTGSNNTAIGTLALCSITLGSNNIALGQNSGRFFSGSSSNNVAIGFGAGPSSNTEESNKLYIASGSGTPLIKGDFLEKTVSINNVLQIVPSNPLPTFTTSLTGSIAFSSSGNFYFASGSSWTKLTIN